MKKSNGQLVSGYLENISREALEKYEDIVKKLIKRRQGIYALYRDKKLYYVGLTTNLRTRFKQHLKDRHEDSWNRFSFYWVIQDNHLKELESLLLRITRKPPGNNKKGRFLKAVDLKRQFKREIKNEQKDELLSLFSAGYREQKKAEAKTTHLEGRIPKLAGLLKSRMRLRAFYHGRTYKALVRKDGSVSFKGKRYTSPSVAGSAIGKRAVNGWHFWKYERAPGEWVKLNELRK